MNNESKSKQLKQTKLSDVKTQVQVKHRQVTKAIVQPEPQEIVNQDQQ